MGWQDATPLNTEPQAGGWRSATPLDQDQSSSAAPINPEDIMLQHMASWLPGASYLHNLTKLGEYGATGGLSNRLDQAAQNIGAYFGAPYQGSTIDEQNQRLQQARNAVGPIPAALAETAGSLAGLGGATSGVPVRAFAEAAPLAAGATGGGFGRALGQGAALGALQGVSTSNNPVVWGTDAAVGGAGGAALHGALTGAGAIGQGIANQIGKGVGALATPEAITDTALANRTAAYDALRAHDVPDAQSAVANAKAAYDAADPSGTLAPRTGAELKRLQQRIDMSGQTISGQQAANWLIGQKGTMSPADYANAWTQLQQTGQMSFPGMQSAHDLVMSLQKLDNIQGPNAGPENELAPIVQGHLQTALDNAGAGPLQDAANAAHKVYKNAQFLQDAGQNLQLLKQSPSSDAANIAQTYYRQGAADLMANRPTPEAAAFKSLADISNAGGGYQTAYGLAHAIHPVVEDAVIGMAGAHLGPALGAAAMYGGIKPALGAALSKLQTKATQGAINRAYPALTGTGVTPNLPDYRRALQTLIMGGPYGAGALP